MSRPSSPYARIRALASSIAPACVLLGLPPLLATPAPAQTPSPTSATAHVRFANRTAFDRVEWGTATVPFAPGVWVPGQDSFVVAGGHDHELVPFGARWPDGSVRFARLDVRLALPAGLETIVEIVPGTAAHAPFAPGPMLAERLDDFEFRLLVGLPGIGVRSIDFDTPQPVHVSHARLTTYFSGRVPDSDFAYDLWLTTFAGQDTAHFELRLTASDPTSSDWTQPVSFVALASHAAIPSVRHARRHGIWRTTPDDDGWNVALLRGPDQWYDGQGYEWRGELLFFADAAAVDRPGLRVATFLAAVTEPLKGVSLDWPATGAFGPFGHVPDLPPWIQDDGRSAATAKRARFLSHMSQVGTPWEDRELGLVKDPGTTGDQYDFGAAKLVDVFRTGLPDRIEEARYSAGEEAMRPVHHREADGSMLLHENHPNWVAWSGRTHFNTAVSPDRLGKPWPEPFPNGDHGWRGKDRQHWSSLTLAATYLLTCSDSLLHELRVEAELFEAAHTLPSEKSGWATNSIGAARGLGRSFNTAAWIWLCTDDSNLANHVTARIDECVMPQMIGLQGSGPVRPVSTYGPDPRLLLVDHWRPWEDAQAVLGLEACAIVFGSSNARLAAWTAARSLTEHAWRSSSNVAEIAAAIAWDPSGAAPAPADYNDPALTLWSAGTAFSEWSLPAVKIAARLAWLAGDTATMQAALTLAQQLRQARTAPAHGGWDRFAEWDHAR